MKILLLIIALGTSYLNNKYLNYLFIKKKYVDVINFRSSHTSDATKTGGISFFITLLLITLIYYFSNNEYYDFSLLLPISLIFLLGYYDDKVIIDYKIKLFSQIIICKLFIDLGFVIDLQYVFNSMSFTYFHSQIITFMFFVVLVNSFNFIDGIDILAISFFFLIIITIVLLKLNNNLYDLNLLSLFIIIPNFYFNLKVKNKAFLGDAGSLVLGSILAINFISLFSPAYNESYYFKNEYKDKFLPFFLYNFLFIDFIRVVIIRLWKRKSPFQPDKNHLHHLVVLKLGSHFKSTLLLILLSIITGSIIFWI